MNQTQIEELLRRAPAPRPPANLKAQLQQQIPHPTSRSAAHPRPWVAAGHGGMRLRDRLLRWWPVLAPACLALACVGAFAYQQARIRELQRSIEELRQRAITPAPAPALEPDAATLTGAAADERQELQRLLELARQFAAETQEAAKLAVENATLRTQLAAMPTALPPEFQQFADAQERARSINCINNLKQIGLAFRVWALDHNDRFPAAVPVKEGGAMGANVELNFQVMSNELSTPKILLCPSDTNRTVAANFASFSAANLSYQYVGANASETEPNAVLVTCPIHGNILLCDGSVQQAVAKTHPERLVQRDGRLYLDEAPAQPVRAAPARRVINVDGMTPPGMSDAAYEAFLRRYGLLLGTNAPEPAPADPQR